MRRVLAVTLIAVTVIVLALATRSRGGDPDAPRETTTQVHGSLHIGGSCDLRRPCGWPGVSLHEGWQADQYSGSWSMDTTSAGDVLSSQWAVYVYVLVLGSFLLMGFSNLWNGRAG
jgi:hypothetical protein